MTLLNITLFSITALLLFSTTYLFILNRNSEIITSKVIPAIIVGLVGTFLTILFSLKENKIQETTVAALIAHAERMTPLEEIKHDYHKFYGGDLFSPRCFINPIKNQKLFDFHFNLVTTEILHSIFETFQAFKSEPDGELFSTSGYPMSLDLSLKRKFITWENYINIFASDPNLYDALKQFNPEMFKFHFMTVPKDTEFYFTNSNSEKSITFKNEFVSFNIKIYRWRGSRNINEWAWILNLEENEKEDFWISKFIIEQEITSNKFRSGHPKMEKHEKWAKEILSRIKEKHDYKQQLAKAMDYSHHFGNKINNK